MPAFSFSRRVSVMVLCFSLLALGASAADKRAGVKEIGAPRRSRQRHRVRGFLRVRAIPPTIASRGEQKLDLAEFDFYKRNLAALIKAPW